MLYRLVPDAPLEWAGFPTNDLRGLVTEYDIDLDKLAWDPTEDRTLGTDLLRIALRHGIATRLAIALEVNHTLGLNRSDSLLNGQQAIDETQAHSQVDNSDRMEQPIPGWNATGEVIEGRVRVSTVDAAQRAHHDLSKVTSSPFDPILAEHWIKLGGTVPNPA